MAGAIVSNPPLVEPPPTNASGSTQVLGPYTFTYAVTNNPQTWTGVQTFYPNTFVLYGTPNAILQTDANGFLSGIAEASTTSSAVFALAPTPNTTKQAINIAQTLPTGTVPGNAAYSANYVSVTNNGYQTPAGGSADSFGLYPVVSGYRLEYSAAGSGIGNFPIHIGGLFAARATSVGQQLVGLNGTTYTNINSSGNDSFWPLIGYGNVGPSANIGGIYGVDGEVAVAAGATVNIRAGVCSTSQGPGIGSQIDGAFVATANPDKYGAPAPWKNAIVLWKSDGATAPIDGSIIISNASYTVQYGLKLDALTFAQKIFDFGSSILQTDGPTGNTTIGGGASGTGSLTLGVAGSNVGKTNYKNATSGTLTIQPPTGALGTVTNTLQAVSDTFVYLSTTDTLSNKTLVNPHFTTGGDLTNNANSPTTFQVINTSTGASALASVTLSNGTDQSAFGVGGLNFTGLTQLTNRAYVHSGSAHNGIVLDAGGAKPIDFYTNNTRVGGFNTGFMVGTSSDPGAGNIAVSSGVKLGSFTVAALPAGSTGLSVFCSNCRVFNGAGTQEGAGSGTGGLVTYNGTAWKIAGTNVTAIA